MDNYRRGISRLMWGISVFFMPEALPAGALQQLLMARRLQKRLHSIRGWDSWALEQSFLIVKNGVKDKTTGNLLTGDKLVELAEAGQQKYRAGIHIHMLPQRDDIGRRSKKSWFEKIIAGGQALWFSANIVSRLLGRYQVTLLEDVTMAYACCGLIAMAAWFRCPQDIEDEFEVDLREFQGMTSDSEGSACNLQVLVNRCISGLMILSLVIVTGVHLAAWQYPFPSAAEAWVWRSCALVTLPLGSLIVYLNKTNILTVTFPVFALARLALWTVACTAFRRMPLSAFDTPNWSDYWGHIGR
ncbi:hypothetical protein SLS64_013051 [Diaporthe eres]|uniref:Uncharacterized protein n=1 Tax=Diaporthe eres TaxID=83184 RepID=A0ABR1P5V3_DIAER